MRLVNLYRTLCSSSYLQPFHFSKHIRSSCVLLGNPLPSASASLVHVYYMIIIYLCTLGPNKGRGQKVCNLLTYRHILSNALLDVQNMGTMIKCVDFKRSSLIFYVFNLLLRRLFSSSVGCTDLCFFIISSMS